MNASRASAIRPAKVKQYPHAQSASSIESWSSCAAGKRQRALRQRDRTGFARVEHRPGQSRQSACDKGIVAYALGEPERSAGLADSGRRSFAEAERFCERQLDLGLHAK